MPKKPQALVMLPPLVQMQLRQLGEHLAVARKRRYESRRVWAARMGVSEPTLMRMEKGDPAVALGIYATALWMIGRSGELPLLAAPEFDQGALDASVRVAKQRGVRKPLLRQQRNQEGEPE